MAALKSWSRAEIVAFRVAAIYFVIQVLPLDGRFFGTNWLNPQFHDLFALTTYMPAFVSAGVWGIESFANWLIALVIAVAGAVLWGFLEREPSEYNVLYYGLRVLLRYRLAVGLIGYGVLKLFKIQLPEPTLSDLHSSYGDYLPWKIYSLTTGIGSAYYEQSIGLVELAAAVLLLFRKTATIGASIAIFVLTNIVIANFAYEFGEHVYSAYLLSIALFLLAYDLPRLYNVFVKRQFTRAESFKPAFASNWVVRAQLAVKILVAVFLVVYGVKAYAGSDNWPFPAKAGLSNAYGFYNVSEYRVNQDTIPYSLTDPERWNNVVFEKWNTISIKRNRPARLDLSVPSITERNYEYAGNASRHFYSYELDTLVGELTLHARNSASPDLHFRYARPDSATIVLSGRNENQDSVRIVLSKINRKYLLNEGRRRPIKIN
ncbi:DoxX family protein [Dyadobacter endophyticus]|uniref:DoxX family protein n=1 Tax=Dyadobacter TaxID=120831 RepID=UPI003CEAAF32